MPSPETTTLGGGCFWCLEAVYDRMEGVLSVESGYMGGALPNPSYQAVCTGTTGHVEVVQVTFDSDIVTFREILEVFFTIHDPTSLDRQGNDNGSQYRSVIFYRSEAQKTEAETLMNQLADRGLWRDPIVTELRPATAFYVAEGYHQEYFANNPSQPYCTYVVAPKVRKFQEHFAAKLRRKSSAG